MDWDFHEQVAVFRYGLIAPIVSRQSPLSPGELQVWLKQTAARNYDIPGTTRRQVSVRSLERFLAAYRSGGFDALRPAARRDAGQVRLPQSIVTRAVELRREQPHRSVEQIILLLEESGLASKGQVAASTLSRHLRQQGVSRQKLLQGSAPADSYRRFEAQYTHQLWQCDAQHTLYLPDPAQPGRRKKAILFAILDDYSRALVHAQFYWDEKLPRLEDTLKKAILKSGIPERFYCDNGAVFSTHHLARICGQLGVHLSHSKPYRPQGRGKIERMFRFVDTSFLHEAYARIESGHVQTLDDLNRDWAAWVDYYLDRVHGTTGQTPRIRAQAGVRETRRKSVAELTEIFLWEETRKVDKTGCVSLFGNAYEVDAELSGSRVRLRYDPFDLTQVQVWEGPRRFADASPLEVTRHHDARVPSPTAHTESAPPPVSFLEAAERMRRAKWGDDPIQVADHCVEKGRERE